jgi:hypothetical protein
MNFDLAQNIDVENVIAEKFAYFRRARDARGHAGPPPRNRFASSAPASGTTSC